MAKLTMGTDGALALQRTIQSELATRGYSSENDPVMAEYITIMVINDKTPEQINGELADLIGPEYESSFTDWLFAETTKAAAPPARTSSPAQQAPSESRREEPPHLTNRRTGPGPTPSLIQNALSGVHPPTGPSASRSIPNLPQPAPAAQKRTASARSPSPSSSSSQPNKARRTDAPTGPRAMLDRGMIPDRPLQSGNTGRSLIDRVGPHNRRGNLGGNGSHLSPAQVSHIQAQIDGITGGGIPRHHMNGRGTGAVIPMNGGHTMNQPGLQDLMALQTHFLAQLAANLPVVNPALAGPPGFPQPNFSGFSQQQQPPNGGFSPGGPGFGPGPRGRGGMTRGGTQGRGGMSGRGRGGSPNQFPVPPQPVQPQQPQPPASSPVTTTSVPERPGTPSLCKYALKCTNPQCRYSHPSPVATVESGVVLSTEFCSNGKSCKDKHCTLGHVSPSVVNGTSQKHTPSQSSAPAPSPTVASSTPCKFGIACTRSDCMFTHPPNFRPPHHSHPVHHHQPATTVPCRFGASCTRGDCPFQHPKGHVSANMFYRGLGPDAPLVEGYVSPHRSVRFGADPKSGPSQPPTKGETAQEVEKDKKHVGAVALGKGKVGEKTVGVGA